MSGSSEPVISVLTVFFILLVGSKPCASLKATLISFELRGVSDRLMPEQVIAKLTTVDNVRMDLNLRHVPHLDVILPLEFISVDAEGRLVTRAEHIRPSSDTSYYQDVQSNAAIQLTRYWDRTHELFGYNMRGHVIFHESIYYLDTAMENANQSETRYQFLTTSPKEPPVQIVSLEGRQLDLVVEMSMQGLKCQEHFAAHETKEGVHREKSKPSGRPSQGRKSRSSDMYFIDIIAVVENDLYMEMKESIKGEFPLKLKEHFAFMFNEVDLLYKNLGTTYTLNVRLNKLIILEDKLVSTYTDSVLNMDKINGTKALEVIQGFLITPIGKTYLQESDHVMVFTSYDLVTYPNGIENNNTAGIAINGAMCSKDGTSCSLIEHRINGFLVVVIVTHELGHSLSAFHDGSNNTCSANDRYIMAPSNAKETPNTILNPFKFSNCSVHYFTEHINLILPTEEGRDCLTKSHSKSGDIPVVSDRLKGLEMSVKEQCEELLGKGSFFCRPNDPDVSKMCTLFMCSNSSNSQSCKGFAAPHPGTPCGKKKICRLGRCESDSRGPEDDACLFGDPPGLVVNQNMTCKEAVELNIMFCYQSTAISRICCESCRYRPIKGCEYGDKKKGCTKDKCKDDAAECCETCHVVAPLAPTTKGPATTAKMGNFTAVPGVSNANATSTTATTVAESVSCAHKMYNGLAFLFSCLCYFLLYPLSI